MSEVKVNKISPRSGTTITLGDSGDTISIPSGVTFDASSGGLAGTLTTAAQPNITSVGTLTSFTSTGIDDNATSTAITIDSNENVGINISSPNILPWNKAVTLSSGGANSCAYELARGSTLHGAFALQGDDRVQVINFQNADLTFNTGTSATERMRIDHSTGNVGIGTSSPANELDVNGSIRISLDGGVLGNGDEKIKFDATGQTLQFQTADTERMRIDSSGNVLVGKTAQNNTTEGVELLPSGRIFVTKSSQILAAFNLLGTGECHRFLTNGTLVGGIVINSSSTSYNTTSDYRIKENVSYDFDATSRLKQLKPARFNFTADADTTVDGFLAHEVSDIVPEAISGEKDATETKEKVVVNANGQVIAENIEQTDWEAGKIADENGNTQYPTDSTWEATKVVPVYQGIDQAKLVPLLVKTIQELEARITALENA